MSRYTITVEDGFTFDEDLFQSLKDFFEKYVDSDEESSVITNYHSHGGGVIESCIMAEGLDEFYYTLDEVGELSVGEDILRAEAQHGGEGEGDQYWFVFSVERGGEKYYFRWDGYYASCDGGHYENFSEVKAKQKTITIFE